MEPAATARAGVRADVSALVELARSLDRFELRLISQCMSDQGLTYVVPPEAAPPAFEKTYGHTTADVSDGYPPLPALPPDPNARSSLKGSQADRDAWNEALFGAEDARETQTLSDGSGELSGPGEGCIAHARDVMFGSSTQGLEVVSLATNLPATAVKAASLDADMVTLNKEWSDCMSDKGHDDLTSPEEAIAAARATGESTATSVRLAKDDVACESASDYAAQRTAVEDRYLTGVMDAKEAQITGARETFTAAISKAKRELSSG
ncbi:hypothetical protein [Janibacter anophelis]|uniref:hypothetical protein n=1 Tax=Janibacter anophelis TaxID=319054 RepID=UPI0012EE80A5|nr:hypothetical protein [Janibacter anophelis]